MGSSPEQAYFDSANIAESYSGVVKPLTCTFARMVYGRVYRDLLSHSGVSKRVIDGHNEVFDGLVALFYGRMYYNMNNWYRLAHFLPGYRRNKANFEGMITSNVRAEVERRIHPSTVLALWYPVLVTVKTLLFGLTCRRFKAAVVQEFTHFVMGGAHEAEPDGQGRVVIPAHLRQWAGLGGETVVIGASRHLEVWEPGRWRARLSAIGPSIGEKLAGLGI